jgi:hypothetical protein
VAALATVVAAFGGCERAGKAAADGPASRLATPEATTEAEARPSPPDLALALGDGAIYAVVGETGVTRRVELGAPRAQVVALVSAAYGPPREEGRLEECGEGPVEFVSFGRGLTAYFQDGLLSGWAARDDPSLGTLAGVRVGVTRAELRAAAPDAGVGETTLGEEFDAEGVSGLLSGPEPDARVEALWSGTACVFR